PSDIRSMARVRASLRGGAAVAHARLKTVRAVTIDLNGDINSPETTANHNNSGASRAPFVERPQSRRFLTKHQLTIGEAENAFAAKTRYKVRTINPGLALDVWLKVIDHRILWHTIRNGNAFLVG